MSELQENWTSNSLLDTNILISRKILVANSKWTLKKAQRKTRKTIGKKSRTHDYYNRRYSICQSSPKSIDLLISNTKYFLTLNINCASRSNHCFRKVSPKEQAVSLDSWMAGGRLLGMHGKSPGAGLLSARPSESTYTISGRKACCVAVG